MKKYKYSHNIIKFTWVCFIDEHGKQHSQTYFIDALNWSLEDYIKQLREYFNSIAFVIFDDDIKVELANKDEYTQQDVLNNPSFIKAMEKYTLCGFFNPYIDESGKRREHPIENKLNNCYM